MARHSDGWHARLQPRGWAGKPRTPLSEALEGAAPFIFDGQHKPLLFFRGGRAEGPWGVGNWWAEGGLVITLQVKRLKQCIRQRPRETG